MNSHPRSHLQRPSSLSSLSPLTGFLKRTITARLNREFGDHLPVPLLRRALEEAESVAHSTGFADLFYPALAEEKVRLVSNAISDTPFAQPRQFRSAA